MGSLNSELRRHETPIRRAPRPEIALK